MTLPPQWLVHDPEEKRVIVDIQDAAAAGAGALIVRYIEETNNIEVRITPLGDKETA